MIWLMKMLHPISLFHTQDCLENWVPLFWSFFLLLCFFFFFSYLSVLDDYFLDCSVSMQWNAHCWRNSRNGLDETGCACKCERKIKFLPVPWKLLRFFIVAWVVYEITCFDYLIRLLYSACSKIAAEMNSLFSWEVINVPPLYIIINLSLNL